jgi:hypothetical protein
MTNFDFSGLPEPQPIPPIDPTAARQEKIANDTRVESGLNRFITAKQEVLFTAPDAFYRTQGEDAIHASPATTRRLGEIKNALLDGLANDYQRKRLGDALDAQMMVTRGGMARHVAEQSLAWQRQIALDRIDLLTREAMLHHSNDDLIDGLGTAAANTARAHARVGDARPPAEVEDRAAASARSRVLANAVQARLDAGNTEGAGKLYDRVQDQLDDAHAGNLGDQIQTQQRWGDARAYVATVAPEAPATSHDEADAQYATASARSTNGMPGRIRSSRIGSPAPAPTAGCRPTCRRSPSSVGFRRKSRQNSCGGSSKTGPARRSCGFSTVPSLPRQ